MLAVVGIVVGSLGFSESCSSELTAKLVPAIGAIPGLVTAWIGRFRQGDVTLAGFKR